MRLSASVTAIYLMIKEGRLDSLALQKHDVHMWYCFPREIKDPDLLARYFPLLNAEEAVQQKRFHFEKHRHQYLITRAMIRTLLSRYVGIAPQDLRFQKNDYGRPELVPEQLSVPLHFNLSHTDGLIVCGVVLHSEIGVDVEDITRGGDLVQIADRFFSPGEVADLHTVPADRQEDRFFDYWTMKEAYIKARGMGLSIPLEQFSYHINDTDTHIGLTVDPRQQDEGSRWQIRQWRCAPCYKVAICLEKQPGVAFEVHTRRMVPFGAEEPLPLRHFRSSESW